MVLSDRAVFQTQSTSERANVESRTDFFPSNAPAVHPKSFRPLSLSDTSLNCETSVIRMSPTDSSATWIARSLMRSSSAAIAILGERQSCSRQFARAGGDPGSSSGCGTGVLRGRRSITLAEGNQQSTRPLRPLHDTSKLACRNEAAPISGGAILGSRSVVVTHG